MSAEQFRVIYRHEGFPRKAVVVARRKTAEKWSRFIKTEWDLHYRCEHANGYEEQNVCEVPPEWKYKDPALLELRIERRSVGEWEAA